MSPGFDCITFLSDYGLTDEFVGVCKGVMRKIAPSVEIIDITHGIHPQSIRDGAMVLAQSVTYMPRAVHLAIVDPGVGSDRMPVIVATEEGSLLVGPDNGLLTLASAALGGSSSAVKIDNPKYMLPKPSRTFHGRDLFSPAAAHLAMGVAMQDFGPALDLSALVQLGVARPRRHDDHYHAEVLHVDRFGNLQLNLSPLEMKEVGLGVGSALEVRVEGNRTLVNYSETFGAAGEGELVVTEDSHGLIAVSVYCGSAAERLDAAMGSSVIVGPLGSGADD